MQERVDETIADDVDVILLVVDARERIGAGDRYVARRVFALGVPVVIALNKVDRLKPGHIATQMKTAATLGDFHALHPVSAKTGDGIDELRGDLVSLLPEGPLLLPARHGHRHAARGAHRRARARAGAAADARGGAARGHRRGGRDRRAARARPALHRDREPEADPDRQGRHDGARDRPRRRARSSRSCSAIRSSCSCR